MRNPNHGATITPCTHSATCECVGCDETEFLARIEPDVREETRILCPQHRVEYLREVYSQ